MIKVLAFGIAREIVGSSEVPIDLPDGVGVAALRHLLTERYPRLGELRSFLLAVNNEYAAADTLVTATDEIAIIPPVSGG